MAALLWPSPEHLLNLPFQLRHAAMPGFFWYGRNHLVPIQLHVGVIARGECGRVIPALAIDNTRIPRETQPIWSNGSYNYRQLKAHGTESGHRLEYEQPVHCERLWRIWKQWPRGELCTESSPPLKISEDKEATVLACHGWIQIWRRLMTFENLQGNNAGIFMQIHTLSQGCHRTWCLFKVCSICNI